MTAFTITINPPREGQWAWTWEMTWYDAKQPLCMAYKGSGGDVYPNREAARDAAEAHAKRIAETVPERYTYNPGGER